MGRYKHFEIDDICIRWQISKVGVWNIKKRILKEFGFCEYKHIEIFLEDRLNIKKLAQKLMSERSAKDIKDLFNNYQSAYIFMINLFSSRLFLTDNQYDKCMLIINKFDVRKDL